MSWQDISSAPKDGTEILVSFGTMGIYMVSWTEPSNCDWEIWCVDDNKHGPYALRGWSEDPKHGRCPTHWMPLPSPPKEPTPSTASSLDPVEGYLAANVSKRQAGG